MQTAYLEAVVNRRHCVLGRELHDLCLYDALFLTLRENPLWLRHRLPNLDDLAEAVIICSLPPERFLRAEMEPRGWWERLSRLRWARASKRREFLAEVAAWYTYDADFNTRPEYWDAAGGAPLRAPWILSVATFLEQQTNMTEREIMTAPIGAMLWKSAALAERLGIAAAEIMTEEEMAIAAEQGEAMRVAGESFPPPREPAPGPDDE